MRPPEEMSEEEKAERRALQAQRRQYRRELLGIAGGIGLAMAVGAAVPAIRENVSLELMILWGGAIGGVVMSLERFERAGAGLTRRENRALNFAVGLGVPMVLLLVLLALR